MPITQKIAAALLLMFVVLLAGAALVLDHAVRPGFERLEADAHQRNLARVAASLDGLSDDVRGRVTDYAMWDATYAFLTGQNPAYPQTFNSDWFQYYGVDFIALVGADGRTLWTRRRGVDGALVSDTAYAAALAARAGPIARANQSVLGATYVEDGLLVIAALPATHSSGRGGPRGLVMMGRLLSEAQLEAQTQLDVQVIDALHPPADLTERMANLASTSQPQSWMTSGELNGLFAIRDFNGRVIAAVLARQPRDISAMGTQAAALALGLFAAICALALAALWLLLRGGVIRRIQRLEHHFNAQTDTLAPMPVTHGPGDEIARLTDSYNALIHRLNETAAREQAAQLQREAEAAANRMKSNFLANVSHELRTPLNAVIGYAELIKEELDEQGVTHADDDLERIVKAARRLLVLTNELLDLSKIEVGKLEMRLESFKIGELLQSALSAVQPLAATQSVALELVAERDLGTAYSDEFRLRQCLINVLASACKFAPNGKVSLLAARIASPDGEQLRFEISDSGPGLTSDQLLYAFEPFQRAGASIAATIGGASLGLAMTRKLLTLLGGHIEVTSRTGEGSTFVIVAPVVADDAPAQTPASRAA